MPVLPSDISKMKVKEAEWQTLPKIQNAANQLLVQFLPKGQQPPRITTSTLPVQKTFTLPMEETDPRNWIWRVEYRVKMNSGEWSEWACWRKSPTCYVRKRDAERRLAQVWKRFEESRFYVDSIKMEFEIVVRPLCVAYDVREARRYARRTKQLKVLERVWESYPSQEQ